MTRRNDRPELVQLAITKALDNVQSFEGRSKFSSWFHAIVRNVVLMDIRDIKARAEVALPEYAHPAYVQESAFIAARTVEKILAGVDEEDRKLLMMRLQGLTWKEIGQELEIPLFTAHQRWRRLREVVLAKFLGRQVSAGIQ